MSVYEELGKHTCVFLNSDTCTSKQRYVCRAEESVCVVVMVIERPSRVSRLEDGDSALSSAECDVGEDRTAWVL